MQIYEGLDNFAAYLMAFMDGFIYTPGKESRCAVSIFHALTSWMNSIDIFTKIWMPWYWPRFQFILQDILYAGTVVDIDCDLTKLFTTITGLISFEGVSELGARVAGAAPFEIYALIASFSDEEATTRYVSRRFGSLFAVVFNYHIA